MRQSESQGKEKSAMKDKAFQSDRVLSYFRAEWKVLLAVTVSGLIYNLGLLARPWFEGQMTGYLVKILNGAGTFSGMRLLVCSYVAAIATVQSSRYIKRFYVRLFANNVNRRMKRILYHSLIHKNRAELREEGEGDVMTKAILDVDDCAEGMRKFTTEIFDTGVALAAYIGMLLWYDWHLALLCLIFPPISYMTAEKMKKVIQKNGVAYKQHSGNLSAATLDRAENAITYRVFGCEKERQAAYEEQLTAYEKAAVKANIWNAVLPSVYKVISLISVVFILYFGQKNVLGTGWQAWDIAAFTTFLSCFVKLSGKSASAAKLFNSVHKAQVSWKRIRPLLVPVESDQAVSRKREEESGAKQKPEAACNLVKKTGKWNLERDLSAENGQKVSGSRNGYQKTLKAEEEGALHLCHVTFAYPNGAPILRDISFSATPGQIIGITGAVACGKSTLGKLFLYEYPYEGEILLGDTELRELSQQERCEAIGYLGHDPELFNDSIEHNVLLGDKKDPDVFLKAVCIDAEVNEMPDGKQTMVGNGGVRLSGGQAQRLALARTLCHLRPVMILDDPFSALDKKTEEEIFSNLRQMAGDAIILLISHRLYLFPQMDQVVWMEDGGVIVAPHETLIKEVPEYAALFEGRPQTGCAHNQAAKITSVSRAAGTDGANLRYTQGGGVEHEA